MSDPKKDDDAKREPNPTSHPEPNKPVPPPTPRRKNGAKGLATGQLKPLRRERPGDPVDFPAPPPEAAAELRRLLPPVRVEVPGRAS